MCLSRILCSLQWILFILYGVIDCNRNLRLNFIILKWILLYCTLLLVSTKLNLYLYSICTTETPKIMLIDLWFVTEDVVKLVNI